MAKGLSLLWHIWYKTYDAPMCTGWSFQGKITMVFRSCSNSLHLIGSSRLTLNVIPMSNNEQTIMKNRTCNWKFAFTFWYPSLLRTKSSKAFRVTWTSRILGQKGCRKVLSKTTIWHKYIGDPFRHNLHILGQTPSTISINVQKS